MLPLKFGRNNINSDRVVNIVTPVSQGNQTNGVKIVLAGSEEIFAFGDEADEVREWLARWYQPTKPTPVVTKAETGKTTTK